MTTARDLSIAGPDECDSDETVQYLKFLINNLKKTDKSLKNVNKAIA